MDEWFVNMKLCW